LPNKNAQLVLFQIDHLCGEEIGFLIDRLYAWGAHNAHAIPTVTKKGRPGYIILVDIGDQKEITLAEALAMEFGLFGYHRIQTVHWHQTSITRQRNLKVRYRDREITLKIHAKICGPEEAPFYARLEHDDLVAVQGRVWDVLGLRIPFPELRQRLNVLAKGEKLVLDLTPLSALQKGQRRRSPQK
jgi:pyridinium-3,5-bisthiocarboxylic acid mononucleotide nickel chelatase